MLDWFRRKDWRDSNAHLLLLSKFRKGDSPNRYRNADDWRTALREDPIQAIERFRKDGALEPATLSELVDHGFKASDLKSMLKDRGLKVSGRKEELGERLIGHDQQAMRDMTKDLDLYRCTAEGTKIAERYLENERIKRDTAQREVLEFITRKEFPKAVRLVAQYEASQVFPRGLGIDWKNYNIESGVKTLESIFWKTPGILRNVAEDRLNKIRLAASMMQLWGTSSAKKWLPDGLETGIHFDGDTACRMLVFHASHLNAMADYREARIRTVEVSGVEDGRTCPACRAISGKKYPLKSVPEFPYEKCTSEFGCRCTTVMGDYR